MKFKPSPLMISGFVQRGAKKDGKSRAWLWMTLVGGGIERGGGKREEEAATQRDICQPCTAPSAPLHWSNPPKDNLSAGRSVCLSSLAVCLSFVCMCSVHVWCRHQLRWSSLYQYTGLSACLGIWLSPLAVCVTVCLGVNCRNMHGFWNAVNVNDISFFPQNV